jgi:tetratricopeptide (TPR) repeat protein
MDTQLAELSRTIDPAILGRRIRNARVAAGLTQTQAGGEYASTPYISRIESGHRRPDLKLLGLIAERLGTTAEELLLGVTGDKRSELRLELDYAELALNSGNPQEAAKRADEVIAAAAGTQLTELERAARSVRALALEAAGDLDAAILALEEFVDGDAGDLIWLRGMIVLSRCYREVGDLARAIEVGDKALTTIDQHGLHGVDEAVQLAVTVAAAYFERGDVRHATRLCRRAITDAESFDSPTAKASAYWNASIVASEQNDVATALPLAAKALAILEVGEDGRNLGRLRTQFGVLQLHLDPPEPLAAKQTLEQARRELEWSSASPLDQADNQLALARTALMLGDDNTAEAQAVATYHAVSEHAPLLAADARVLEGQVAARHGRTDDARAAYMHAILLLSGVGADRGAAQLWFELGGLLEELGDGDASRDAYRRAAASTGLTMRHIPERSHTTV